MNPQEINILNYSYSLPAERIAIFPLGERDASKLLIYRDGQISEDIYRNIADHIPSGTTLVFNDTRVVEARLLFQKPTGGVSKYSHWNQVTNIPDITLAMSKPNRCYGNA
jgi:S-adenosylmethionine:tRNA ribosyltransferase-isomerase